MQAQERRTQLGKGGMKTKQTVCAPGGGEGGEGRRATHSLPWAAIL